jgi:purine nucleoside phosphorylase
MTTWEELIHEAEVHKAAGFKQPTVILSGELVPAYTETESVEGLGRVLTTDSGLSCLHIHSATVHERIRSLRIASQLGARYFVLVDQVFPLPGSEPDTSWSVVDDQANFTGWNPLTGPNDERFGPRFPDMSAPFDHAMKALLLDKASELELTVGTKILAGIDHRAVDCTDFREQLLRAGAQYMSYGIVHEVIAAHHLGLRTLALVTENPGADQLDSGSLLLTRFLNSLAS